MEHELIKYREIQRVTLNSENLHNKIAGLELERRKGELDICENKQKFLNRVAPNKIILCVGDNARLAGEADQYVSNKLNELEILGSEDRKLDKMLKENKYNFAIANQN